MTTAPHLPPEVVMLAQYKCRFFPVCRPGDLSFEERDRGKAPARGFVEWQKRATSDLAQLGAWGAEYPGCNWGLATGAGSGVIVIDIDGEAGYESKAALEKQGFVFPVTFAVLTGRVGGGEHDYYLLPPGVLVRNNNNGKLGPHLDVRGEGGYVVGPGSTHLSGRKYQIVNPGFPLGDLPDFPAWAIQRLNQSAERATPPTNAAGDGDGKIRHPDRHNYLISLAGTMAKRGMSLDAITQALLVENEVRCEPPSPEEKVREAAEWAFGKASTAPTAAMDPLQTVVFDERPKVRLSGDNYLLSQTATELSRHLADKPIYTCNDLLVTVEGVALKAVSPQAFRTTVERHIIGFRIRSRNEHFIHVGVTMSNDDAAAIMSAPQFTDGVRRVRRLNLVRLPKKEAPHDAD